MQVVGQLTQNDYERFNKRYKALEASYKRTVTTSIMLYTIGLLTIIGIVILTIFIVIMVVPFWITHKLTFLLPDNEPLKATLVSNTKHIENILS